MSAAAALRMAQEAGVRLEVDGGDLVLEAAAPPTEAVLDLLRRHKAEILALLQDDSGSWSAEDWRAYFGERAGIAEFDGGLPPAEAERLGFEACVAAWIEHRLLQIGADPKPDVVDQGNTSAIRRQFMVGSGDRDGSAEVRAVDRADRLRADAVAALRAMGIPTSHT